jgi:hypothetical protein
MADFTIFYSWQSDAPPEINRKFIEKALREAVEEIRTEHALPDLPVVDQGMERVPGSPEIATIMFRKIGRSAIFVGDLTLVGEIKGNSAKKIPNANVSVEMGYAAAYMGWERIICVMNETPEYGKAEEQPVDTRNRRFPINYTLSPSKEGEAKAYKGLVKDLRGAIQTVFTYDLESAKDAVRLLDIHCINLITASQGKEFSVDPTVTEFGGPLDTPKLTAAVGRLLDLGLIWTDTAPRHGKWAYHWTFKGKKVCELLGHNPNPAVPQIS